MSDGKDDSLETKLKQHIQIEEGMDESLLSFYIESAENYVFKTTGSKSEYLVIMVAALMYEYRVSEEDLQKALKAIEPFLILEVLTSGSKKANE